MKYLFTNSIEIEADNEDEAWQELGFSPFIHDWSIEEVDEE